jgi:hypothetical protein
MDKQHWGRFSPSTSISPAKSHFTDCSTLITTTTTTIIIINTHYHHHHPGLV